MFLLLLCIPFALLANIENWIVYYGNEAKRGDLSPYQLLVLDAYDFPPSAPFKETNKILLAYLNIGEVEEDAPYYHEVKEEGILLEENQTWKKSHMIDLRDPRWKKRVVEEIIPYILHVGFDGIFLDTLDNAEFLEEKDPLKYKGMKKAAIGLISKVRENYPTLPIMVNRGYALLPQTGHLVQMVLAESFISTYDFKTKTYVLKQESEVEKELSFLRALKNKYPSLQFFSLDYWDPKDKKGLRQIYAKERENGLIPYVGTIELQTIIREPSS